MASNEHNTSRAALLGLIAAASFAAGAIAEPANAAPTYAQTDRWTAAFERWQLAHDALGPRPSDAQADEETAAWTALNNLPAPDLPALLWKLEYLFGKPGSDGHCEPWTNHVVQAVMADARRLLAA